MTNTCLSSHSPGQEGPSYEPPPNLPEGWIPQWDAVSKKYYYVQLSTGASQWETPTKPAPTGPTPQATPQQGLEHPYGHPGSGSSQQLEDGSVIVGSADGSQSLRRPDGSVEPLTGDRSLGSDLGVCSSLVGLREGTILIIWSSNLR